MAQYRAFIQGQRGPASRLGSKRSGIWASVNGWHDGVHVVVSHENGRDCFKVYRTAGSNGDSSQYVLVAEWGGKIEK